MSIETRQKLVKSKNLVFQKSSHRADFLDPRKTRTELIALFVELIGKGHRIEITCVNSDHHDDRDCGEYCHTNGACADFWAGRYADGTWPDACSSEMRRLVRDIMASRWTYQLGLAGTANCQTLINSAGYLAFPINSRLFPDNGDDHLHVGCFFKRGI